MLNLGRKRKKILNKTTPFATLALMSCGSGSEDGVVVPNNIQGSVFSDYIRGTSQEDRILGLEGDDQIFGFSGNDTLYPGLGNDRAYAGEGNDKIFLEDFAYLVDGGPGEDTLVLSGRLQTRILEIDFEAGILETADLGQKSTTFIKNITTVEASNSRQIKLECSDEIEKIYTGLGNDTINFVGDNDEIYTNSGNDIILIIDVPKILDGGFGFDTLKYDFPNKIEEIEIDVEAQTIRDLSQNNIGKIINFENYELLSPNNTIVYGSALDEMFLTGGGDDTINGKGGFDVISTGGGTDTVILETNDGSITTITDFTPGNLGDSIKFSGQFIFKYDDPNIITVDTQTLNKKINAAHSDVLIFSRDDGYQSINDVRADANIYINNDTSTEGLITFIGLWYNSSKDWVEVSLISKTNALSNIFDDVESIIILENLDAKDLSLFSIENFLIA